MKTLKVTKDFYDSKTGKHPKVGQIITRDDDRAKELSDYTEEISEKKAAKLEAENKESDAEPKKSSKK